MKAGRRRLWVAGGLIVAAIGFLLYKGIGDSLVYYETVGQALSSRARIGTGTFNLEGSVVPGTLRRVPGGLDFDLSSAGATVAVQDSGSPPQLFRPGASVVLVGHFAGSHYVSDQIMVKHSATYTPARRAAAGPG